MVPMTMELVDAGSPRVARIWRALEAGAPSYFQTWGWISTWLARLPAGEAPSLAVIGPDASPRAACFLSRRRLVRHGFVSSRALFLNTTGDPRLDDLTIEHNAVLRDPASPLTLGELVAALPGDWDELFLPALSPAAFPGSAVGEAVGGVTVQVERTSNAPFVDLAQVRSAPGGYLSLLGSGTRAQIRRAQRKFGALALEVATELPQAQDIYTELVALHGASWRSRGQPGSFADAWFDGFHRALIVDRFAHGEIQLCRIRAAGATIGCLYNYVWGGRVHFYQSGFASFDDPHLKPGYVCHVEAVQHAAAAGHRIYDFLAGATQYKESLSTGAAPLTWARVQRPLARFAVEKQLGAWRRGLRQLAGSLQGR
jgi:CelD/BcsL family acetyltransferase involved in cellulose biosynthesis